MKYLTALISKLDMIFLKLQQAIIIFSTAMIIILMCISVVMRYFLNSNFNGLEELILILGFWIYFFGGSIAYRDNDHMEASIIYPSLKTNKQKSIYLTCKYLLEIPVIFIVVVWSYNYIAWSMKFLPATAVHNIPYVVSQTPILICYFLAFFYTIGNVVKTIALYHKQESTND